jgi:uncharacterized protein YecE (DUF72 family)
VSHTLAIPDKTPRKSAEPRARIGCSGWQYNDWRGRVYPVDAKPRQFFALYAELFDTVELNSTFYRLPSTTAFDQWEQAAPPDFVYALKLGSFGSHRMKLRDAGSWLPNHVDRARRLGRALGPTLVQLPPKWKRNAERLDEFLTAAPSDMRWAVELRERSWLHDDVFAVLERHHAALCIHDLLDRHPWIRTTDWVYARFHGPCALTEPYQGRYGPRRLTRYAERFAAFLQDGCDVYAYFNNDVEANAVTDARTLRAKLAALRAAS